MKSTDLWKLYTAIIGGVLVGKWLPRFAPDDYGLILWCAWVILGTCFSLKYYWEILDFFNDVGSWLFDSKEKRKHTSDSIDDSLTAETYRK